jgi:4,5:9,10-diseco-3-hydroxy-5,9,17-trioxoandrosta-1(10),2-diene-4-oate hydrolase
MYHHDITLSLEDAMSALVREHDHIDAPAAAATPTSPRAALGAAAPRHELEIDGVRLAYGDGGSGPPIVCLHAIGHGGGDFSRLRARFGGRHRVIALDWPGHGHSGNDHSPTSAARYTELLGGLVEALGLERAVLVGNSIGGAVALRYAAAEPSRVRGLVIENAGGLEAVGLPARLVTGAMARFFDAGARGARWFPAAYAAYYRLVLPCPAAGEQRRRIVAAGPQMAAVLRDAWRSFGQPDADLRGLIPRITCPVLFAWAKRDRFIQLRRNRAAIGAFPNARLETFAAGHAAHLETPDAFEACVEGFLVRLP